MNVIRFETIDSTNKYAKENSEKLNSGTFIVAKNQTSGKGRNDRKWLSNDGENLLFSVIYKNKKILKNFNILSIGFACIIGQCLENIGVKNVSIKWPNDVYVNDKKICGILLEGNVDDFIVVGVGLNVDQTVFEGEYRTPPTSIKKEIGKSIAVDVVENSLFKAIHKSLKNPFFKIKTFKYFSSHNYLMNKKIKLNKTAGICNGFDEKFRILIDSNPYESGEIFILNK